jgi:hypothetical protein
MGATDHNLTTWVFVFHASNEMGSTYDMRVVRDDARSGVGRRDHGARRVGLPGDPTADALEAEWILHRVVVRIGLAVSESCARATSRGLRAGGLTQLVPST